MLITLDVVLIVGVGVDVGGGGGGGFVHPCPHNGCLPCAGL